MQPNPVLKFLGLGDLSGKGFRAHFSFWSVVAMTFFLFGDQNLTSSNLSRIGADFGFTKEADYKLYIGAYVSIFFFIVGGAVSIFMGFLTDQWDRKKLLVAAVLLGEIPCALTAFAPNYTWFLTLRTLTGIGLGGIFPIIYSLLGDYFKPENRATATGWLGMAMGLGIATGQILSGGLAHSEVLGLPGWRASFLVMAAPAFPLVLLYLFVGSTPSREGSGGHDEKHTVTMEDIKRVFSNKTNILALLQGIPGTVPWGLLFTFMVDFFEKSKGYHVQQANLLVMAFGAAAILGGFIGGFIGGKIYNSNKRMLPIFCAATVLLGSIPVFFLVNYSRKGIELTDTTYKHTGLKNGTDYVYKIKGMKDGKASAFLIQVSGTPGSVAPNVPQKFKATANADRVELSWQAVPGARQYNVYWSEAENFESQSKPGTQTTGECTGICGFMKKFRSTERETSGKFQVSDTTFVHTAIEKKKSYYYKVTAITNEESQPSSRLSIEIDQKEAAEVANSPSSVTIESGDGENTVTWSQVPGAAYSVFFNTTNAGEILIPILIALIGGIVVPMTGANVRAILINTNLPENRGSIFSVFNLTDDMGKGLGPFFVGFMAAILPETVAYNLAVAFWIPCGLIWLFMLKTMVKDEDRVQEILKKRAG